jgi:ketosteroid isomerase-like protein
MRNLLDKIRNLPDNIGNRTPREEPMSATTVAVVQGVYESFAKGDIPAVLAALAPELEWVESPQEFLPHRGTHRTPDAVATHVFGMVVEHFDDFAVVPERFHDAGDTVVVEGRARGTTKTGRTLDAPAAWVWTVREGQVVANHNFHDTDAWRLALTG